MEDVTRLMLTVMKRADKQLVRLSIYGDSETIDTMYQLRAMIAFAEEQLEKSKAD